MIKLILLLVIISFNVQAKQINGGTPVPKGAQIAGYNTLTFSTDRNFSASNVDLGCTHNSGYQWYVWNYFGNTCERWMADDPFHFLADGSIKIDNSRDPSWFPTLATTTYIGSSPNFRGTAFGGGAYIEAEISIDEEDFAKGNWIPAFWMHTLNHNLGTDAAQQWIGMPSPYAHFQEVDIMEFPFRKGSLMYTSTIHDLYGHWGVTCPGWCKTSTDRGEFSHAIVPKKTNWIHPHRYGVLWVPATADSLGYYEFYFDDQPIAYKISYTQYLNQPAPPTDYVDGNPTWTYGFGDVDHYIIIINTAVFKSVKIWQKDASHNISN